MVSIKTWDGTGQPFYFYLTNPVGFAILARTDSSLVPRWNPSCQLQEDT